MYKALKDKKIIAISDTDNEFKFLVKDSIVEDKKHTVSDYEEYKGEYLLKDEVPHPSDEEQREKRANAYREEIDPITSHIQRLRDETPLPQEEIDELVTERNQKVEEIKARFPYYGEENE